MIQVELDPFSGPMDLLLDLVHQSKLDIYDIEISSITEQFIDYMQRAPISPDDLSDFIRMASVLVHMKARTLLKDQEEEEDEGLSREELIQRLLEYEQCKIAAGLLKPLEGSDEGIYHRLPEDLSSYQKSVDMELDYEPQALANALLLLLREKEDKKKQAFSYETIVRTESYSVEAIERRIRRKLAGGEHFTFLDLICEEQGRPAVIVAFLQLLELTRREMLHVKQNRDHTIEIDVISKDRWKQWEEEEESRDESGI